MQQLVLMCGNVVKSQFVDVVDGLCQRGDAYIVGRACLEFERQFGKRGLVERHMTYHLASTLIGRQLLEPLALAIEHSHTRWPIHLVT